MRYGTWGKDRGRLSFLGIALMGGLVAVSVAQADPAPPDSVLIATVTYVAGGSIYVDAGRETGVGEDAVGTVIRGGKPIATVRVAYLSARRAACAIVTSQVPPEVGDKVRFSRSGGGAPSVPSSPTPAVTAVEGGGTGPVSKEPSGGWMRRNGLRGRLGVRYLSLQDQGAGGESFTQPAFDVNLRGTAIGGGPFDLAADLRQRRTTRTLAGGGSESDGRTRVYALNGTWRATPGLRVTLGRQISASLPSVGTFDGFLAAAPRGRFGFGTFAGTQPDPLSYGVSGDILEFGAFTEVQGGAPAGLHGSVTGGVVASTADGASNREYLFLKGQLNDPRLSAYALQEIDHNRGWKAEVEGRRWSATSTYLFLRTRVAAPLDLHASFDNRRSVRLYRDRDTPETEFDDSYRRGVSGGADLRLARRFRIGGSLQSSRSAGAGTADAYTLALGADRISPLAVNLSSRHTRYLGPLAAGWLHAFSAGGSPASWLDLSAHAGMRNERKENPGARSLSTRWYGTDADLGLRRGWYLLLSFEAVRGDDEKTNQVYSSLSYRF